MAKQIEAYDQLFQKGHSKVSIHNLLHKLVTGDTPVDDTLKLVNEEEKKLYKS